MKRHTLASAFEVKGRGLHSAEPVTVRVSPGDDGIAFRSGASRVAALAENVTDTRRCTCLGEIATVEHLLSALSALGVTDAEVEVKGQEMPGLDGSALPWVEQIRKVGLEDLGDWHHDTPARRVFAVDGERRVSVSVGEGHWRCIFDAGERWPGEQSAETSLVDYEEAIAPARTFAFHTELPHLKDLGLGQGLDESSALVLGEDGYVNEARFDNEPARHKLLDLLGDLALTGIPAAALNVEGHRCGHDINVRAAAEVRAALR